jgi:hypothetical protein
MTSYRVEYTEMKPGGARDRQCDIVRGSLDDVRAYFDARSIYGLDPIVVVEHTQSDGNGRVVPASEWDVYEEEN